MLFCKISEHILDEILISGKVQIVVSRLDETDRQSTYNTDIRIFKIFQDRTFGYNQNTFLQEIRLCSIRFSLTMGEELRRKRIEISPSNLSTQQTTAEPNIVLKLNRIDQPVSCRNSMEIKAIIGEQIFEKLREDVMFKLLALFLGDRRLSHFIFGWWLCCSSRP